MDDTIPPVITDISVICLANNSAKVTWETDEFADSVVKYGINSTAYTELSIDVLFVKDHEITLTGLSPDTTYYFVVNSTDQSGNHRDHRGHGGKILGALGVGTLWQKLDFIYNENLLSA
jgi:chitodextrinase